MPRALSASDYATIKELLKLNVKPKYISDLTMRSRSTISAIDNSTNYEQYLEHRRIANNKSKAKKAAKPIIDIPVIELTSAEPVYMDDVTQGISLILELLEDIKVELIKFNDRMSGDLIDVKKKGWF